MTLYNNSFSDLENFVYDIESLENFDTVTKWMEGRFKGLPIFHKSVHLKVKRLEKLIEEEAGQLRIPKAVLKMADPHLKHELNELISYMQHNDGVKSFGLLHLSVKLMPHLLQHELKKYRGHGRQLPNYLLKIGSLIEVPIILAVASRKANDYYESLAVGLSGIGSYRSALSLFHCESENKYRVHAGLTATVSLEHINHILPEIMNATNCNLLPTGFLNRYLQNHLIPEREQIVKKLCKYVFQGCAPVNKFSPAVNLTPIENIAPILY